MQEEVAEWAPHADATRVSLPHFLGPHIDLSNYTEVNLAVGDVLVLDPMCMHSASPNAGAIPARHVVRPTPLDPTRICCRLPSAFLLHFPSWLLVLATLPLTGGCGVSVASCSRRCSRRRQRA